MEKITITSIDELEGLSPRAYNLLCLAGYTLPQLMRADEEQLMRDCGMDASTARETHLLCASYDWQEESIPAAPAQAEDPALLLQLFFTDPAAQEKLSRYLRTYDIPTPETGLPVRAINCLCRARLFRLSDFILMDLPELMKIRNMGQINAQATREYAERYLIEHAREILSDSPSDETPSVSTAEAIEIPIVDPWHDKRVREKVLAYLKENDLTLSSALLSVRTYNALKRCHIYKMSQLVLLPDHELTAIRNLGAASVHEIKNFIADFRNKHHPRLMAYITGDESALLDETAIRKMILDAYGDKPFIGFSFADFRRQIPAGFPDAALKKLIGSMLAEGILEYVDFRCYRVYEGVESALQRCPCIDDRNREMLLLRFQDATLETIGQKYDLTRERVRQILVNSIRKLRIWYNSEQGIGHFDEDYYRYFYSTYDVDRKTAEEWLSFPRVTYSYLEMVEKRGSKPIEDAAGDSNVDAGLRLRVRNYENRKRLFVNGEWIEKTRLALENYAVRMFCREDTRFSDFAALYNDFLQREGISAEEDLYITDAVERTRKARLSDSHMLLWKPGELIRYYDIDARDYTELLDTLELDGYRNIDISTRKLTETYAELMERYDIRDHYELHNLLRKILPADQIPGFRFGRSPALHFGTFDRDAALLDILAENTPISQADLCRLIEAEYGHDPGTIAGNYLRSLEKYYYQGVYSIKQKLMSEENRAAFAAKLDGEFYYLDELRQLYSETIPGADVDEINPYNLKVMGFSVFSRYAMRGYPSLEAYFRKLLTEQEMTDTTAFIHRFASVPSFYQTSLSLRRDLEVVEYAPRKLIHIRRLRDSGIDKDSLRDFSAAAVAFAGSGFFNVHSLRLDGFDHKLFELGFDDWFYDSLLLAEVGLSFSQLLRCQIFRKNGDVSIRHLTEWMVAEHGSIDVFDLMSELESRFGCKVQEKWAILFKLGDSPLFHDKTLDRLYANRESYYRDLDRAGGI